MSGLIAFIFFLLGLAGAIIQCGFFRSLPGVFGMISLASVGFTLLFFLRQARFVVYFAAGLALGLACFSGYAFLTWFIVAAAAGTAGYFLSNSIITDQSLFALVALNLILHLTIFGFELIFSNLFAGGSLIRLYPGWTLVASGLKAILLETLGLYLFFLFYRKVRGKRAVRLSHIA